MRLSATGPGRFSSRLMVGLRAQIGAALRQAPDRHLEGGIGFERIAVGAVGIARRDQQRPIADHLRQTVPHPLGCTRILDAVGQPIGDPEPLLDRCQQQYSGVRGQPPAVERHLNRLARDRWKARQNPRTIVHGGRELRASVLRLPQQQNHTRIQRLVSRPPAPSTSPMNYPG
jgi:hypothetical protein